MSWRIRRIVNGCAAQQLVARQSGRRGLPLTSNPKKD